MLCFVVETQEKRLMNRSTAPAVSALTDKHWRHSEKHKSLKDDGDELKASFWLIFPATQCFDMRETSQKLKHDQDASHGSAWEEIVDEYFSIQTSDNCTVGPFSHKVHLSDLIHHIIELHVYASYLGCQTIFSENPSCPWCMHTHCGVCISEAGPFLI